MSDSNAERLLAAAVKEKNRLRRHLLVAAALRDVLQREPVVVGGTAEEYHSAAPYHETDLDMCGWVTEEERGELTRLGFEKVGRHWFHGASKVAVEFPDSIIDGEESRIERIRVASGTAAMIGLDDLYLDRLRQATAAPHEGSVEYMSALAVAAGTYGRLDRRYVLSKIKQIQARKMWVGPLMRKLDSKIMRKVRRTLT